MKKILLTSIAIIALHIISYGQEKTLEQVAAENVCVCMEKININDSEQIREKQINDCYSKMLKKYQNEMIEKYKPEVEPENPKEFGEKMGRKFATNVNLQLANNCTKFVALIELITK